jgi:hypothetical protein
MKIAIDHINKANDKANISTLSGESTVSQGNSIGFGRTMI